MVVVRCLDHPPDKELYDWAVAVEPVGHPDTALVCGYRTHTEPTPGVVWLTGPEYTQYQHGRRVASLTHSSTQIRLSETVLTDVEPSTK